MQITNFLHKINPVYKCISIIISALLLSFTFSIDLNLWVFFISFFMTMLCSNVKFKTLLFFLIPVLITAIGLFMTGLIFYNGDTTIYHAGIAENMDITSAYNGLQLASRVFAFAGLGMLFTFSTCPIELVYSLSQQLKLSPKFAYGILAAFHLLPNIKREFENARFALNIRGISCHIFSVKPIFAMFVNAVRWAECLAMAMESKGFSSEGSRSSYVKLKIHYYDIVFLIAPSAFILIYLLLLQLNK